MESLVCTERPPYKSILESDMFRDREKERERMVAMFTNEEARKEVESAKVACQDGVS